MVIDWVKKYSALDSWSQEELAKICVGYNPDARQFDPNDLRGNLSQQIDVAMNVEHHLMMARDAIQRALDSKQLLPCYQKRGEQGRFVNYFKRADAIEWIRSVGIFTNCPSVFFKVTECASPRWSKWVHMRDVEIWQAVALSLNIEPETCKPKSSWMAEGKLTFEVGEEFNDRMSVVISRFHDIKPGKIRLTPEPTYVIDLQMFVRFAKGLGWVYPIELDSVLSDTSVESEPDKVEDSERLEQIHQGNEHRSDKLQFLIQAADKFWSTADRKNAANQPLSEDIERWLKERGYTQTLAEQAARIIRPSWAKNGRRPNED